MEKRLALIVALVIAVMTSPVVRADSHADGQDSFRAEKAQVALQSAGQRSLLEPDEREGTRPTSHKGSGLAVLSALSADCELTQSRSAPTTPKPPSHLGASSPRRSRAPPLAA